MIEPCSDLLGSLDIGNRESARIYTNPLYFSRRFAEIRGYHGKLAARISSYSLSFPTTGNL